MNKKSKKALTGKVNQYLVGKYSNMFPKDQIFSVEVSLDSLIPWLNYYFPIEGKTILVFGTGLGGTTVACALNVGEGIVHGVDISEDAIEKTLLRAEAYGVKDKVSLKYMKDTYPLEYPDYYFDAIFITDVIEHITGERKKYIQETFRVLKKGGLLLITGTPNLLFAKDNHTTGLYFVPWMSSNFAYKYSVFRKKWKAGENLEYAGRRGTTYWHIIKWLIGYNYEVLNLKKHFTSDYLKNNFRLNSLKRKILFFPYCIIERILSKVLNIPMTAILPYINHLFIIKK